MKGTSARVKRIVKNTQSYTNSFKHNLPGTGSSNALSKKNFTGRMNRKRIATAVKTDRNRYPGFYVRKGK